MHGGHSDVVGGVDYFCFRLGLMRSGMDLVVPGLAAQPPRLPHGQVETHSFNKILLLLHSPTSHSITPLTHSLHYSPLAARHPQMDLCHPNCPHEGSTAFVQALHEFPFVRMGARARECTCACACACACVRACVCAYNHVVHPTSSKRQQVALWNEDNRTDAHRTGRTRHQHKPKQTHCKSARSRSTKSGHKATEQTSECNNNQHMPTLGVRGGLRTAMVKERTKARTW